MTPVAEQESKAAVDRKGHDAPRDDLAGELLKQARPALIGAALGAVTAAGLAKRSSLSLNDEREDESSDEQRTSRNDRDGSDAEETPSPTTADVDRSTEQAPQREGDRMSAKQMRQFVIEGMLQQLARETRYYDVPLMNRLERMIRSREEFELYVYIIIRRVASEQFITGDMFNRLERLIGVLGRLEQSSSASASAPMT